MFNPYDVIDFLEYLDEIDKIQIEENQNGENVTLNDIKLYNSGNNCLHYILVHNNHRIVIQTYKEMDRKDNLDIVQGKPELEDLFADGIEVINARPQDFTDIRLNKLFVLYCGIWSKWITSFSWNSQKMNSFVVEFGSNITLWWVDDTWRITSYDVTLEELNKVYSFINAVEDICNG